MDAVAGSDRISGKDKKDIRNIGRRRPKEEKFLEEDKRQGNNDEEGLPRPKSGTRLNGTHLAHSLITELIMGLGLCHYPVPS